MAAVGYLETGVLYCDDNLRRLAQFPAECIDLIYLDPPFFSNRNYEVIWGDEAEVRSFEDRWEGGIQVYVNWMKERMLELHRILKPTGSIYLHCDWHASHYLKVMMDSIFEQRRFLNEIVWHYKTFHGVTKRPFARKHDVLLLYSKGKDYVFNPLFDTNVEDTIDGKRWRKWLVDGNKIKGANMPMQDSRFRRYHRRFVREHEREPGLDDVVFEVLGQQIDTVWPIKAVDPKSAERIGYPTQKPEELLERVIKASSNVGDIVLDPFCGCGTALVVAERLKRAWVGVDISPTAVGVMKRRMLKTMGVTMEVVGMPVSEDELQTLMPFEFQNWVMQRLNGTSSPRKTGDMGIDGFSFMYHDPIQVKQSAHVGRNVVDNFETAIERAGRTKGYIIAFSFTRGAHEEAARAKASKGLDVKLIKIASLIGPEDQPDLRTPELSGMFPKTARSFLDLPIPDARPSNARPSGEELVASDKS